MSALRDRLFALETFGIKLGLDNINTLLDGLGRPEQAWPSIHVAGTNGKGSVTAMIERGLRAAGHRTGRYTSPHLADIEERIAVDGVSIAADRFEAAAADVFACVDRLAAAGTLPVTPTFFEVTTAIAFELFRRERVTAAVIEVGLGGRFDATNAITPQVAAITSIAFDHERHLGRTLAEIAFEKAGIIKPGVPVVVGAVPAEAMQVIAARAGACGAALVAADDRLVERVEFDRGRATVTYRTPVARYERVRLGLSGAHQVGNAAVAIRALETFAAVSPQVNAAAVLAAARDVEWPARLEWLRLAGDRFVLIDAAHNPSGAAALADYARASGIAPLPVVLAMMKDKDARGIIAALAPIASSIVATDVGSPRALPAGDLAAAIAAHAPALPVAALTPPDQALRQALATSPRVVVAGSIFLVGPIRASLIEAGARPADGPL